MSNGPDIRTGGAKYRIGPLNEWKRATGHRPFGGRPDWRKRRAISPPTPIYKLFGNWDSHANATLQMMDKKYFIPASAGNTGNDFLSYPRREPMDRRQSEVHAGRRMAAQEPRRRTTRPQRRNISAGGQTAFQGRFPTHNRRDNDTSTARLTAVANDKKYVGRGWLPITGPSVPGS